MGDTSAADPPHLSNSVRKPSPISVFLTQPNGFDLLEQGRQLYEAGQFAEAVEMWQQAVVTFEAQGDRLNQAVVLSNLSSAFQQMQEWDRAEDAIAASLEQLQNEPDPHRLPVLAQALNTQGNLQLALSQPEAALESFEQAAAIYEDIGDQAAMTRSAIATAQALQALGLYRRALATLTPLNLTQYPDPSIQVAGLHHLGNVLRVVEDWEQSQQVLEQSLAVAEQSNDPAAISAVLFALGNTAQAQQDREAALAFYQRAFASASPTLKLQIQLEQVNLLLETGDEAPAIALFPSLESQLDRLPASPMGVYSRIDLAESLLKLPRARMEDEFTSTAVRLLTTAVQQAQYLGDRRGESYALGQLGKLYLQTQQWQEARSLTEKALRIAQAIDAPDVAYLWHWQLGQLLQTQGDREGTIAAYTEAVNALQSLRSDLVAVNPEVQFDFKESVEPVYRELVDLLLQPPPDGGEVSPENLLAARNLVEALQVAELENFFRQTCIVAKQEIDEVVDAAKSPAAIVYPVILPDRLEVILKLPQQPLRHSSIIVTVLLDREFTEPNLENQIDRAAFPVVHLATHGQFSSEAEDTFILAWDKPIAVSELHQLIRNSETQTGAIELLVLSACQTATGDKRAALGLAGVAVRAGARSTLASLWNLDDETSALLMSQFYREFVDPTVTKANALRQAQLVLLQHPRYQHPRYWAPYVLVGNWL